MDLGKTVKARTLASLLHYITKSINKTVKKN